MRKKKTLALCIGLLLFGTLALTGGAVLYSDPPGLGSVISIIQCV